MNDQFSFFHHQNQTNKIFITTIETKAKTPSYLNCSRDKVDDEKEEEDQI